LHELQLGLSIAITIITIIIITVVIVNVNLILTRPTTTIVGYTAAHRVPLPAPIDSLAAQPVGENPSASSDW